MKTLKSVTVTTAKLQSVLKKYPVAEAALKMLAPKAFQPMIGVPLEQTALRMTLNGYTQDGVVPRTSGKYEGLGFYLNDSYSWKVVEDDECCLVLVPSVKK